MPTTDILLSTLRESLAPAQPVLAEALRACTGEVCDRHVEQVQRHIPTSHGLDESATRDDLPDVVEGVADALEHKDQLAKIRLLGPAHASARFGQAFSLEEVIAEYVILRQTMEQCIREQLGREMTAGERDGFQGAVDLLMMQVVASYTAQREAGLRLETAATSRFLGSIAHDLRNQLNSVMLAMQMLGETGRDVKEATQKAGLPGSEPMWKQLDELLGDVGECRQMMDSTIQTMTRVLEAERVRSGVTLRVRQVALRSLLQGLARSAGRNAGPAVGGRDATQENAAGVLADISIECPPELQIQTDPDLLSTVLSNLIGNAVKYAGYKPIHLHAGMEGPHRCRIEVRDQGPGIPPEMLEHLFEQFHRAGRSDSSGMGLGLFIARRAADLLSARLDVQSTPAKGCVFSIDLPSPPPTSITPETPPAAH